jgi:NNP family nitrate/nitrite transporter-like MFS transporter
VYGSTLLPNLHTGYSVVAVSMIPIVLLAAWVFQPRIAKRATSAGILDSRTDSGTVASGDD